jgi:two-component system sensor histidine kinase UhpB
VIAQRRTVGALALSEQRLNDAQRIAQVGSWDVAHRTNKLHWSAEMFRIYGVDPNQARLTRELHAANVHPDDRHMIDQAFAHAVKSGSALDLTHRVLTAHGGIKYVRVRCQSEYDDAGRPVRSFGTAQDVTEKHKLYLRIRELAQRLEAVREDEHRVVAQALHESIAQDLFAVRLGLEHLRRYAQDPANVTHTCGELIEIVDKCSGTTRQIANDLLPTTIAHLSLTEALEDYAQHFGQMSGLSIRVAETSPLPTLDEAIKLNLFRAAQEALTNVAQHAHASSVEILLRALPRSLVMSVADDGIGIDLGAPAKAGSLGLLAIRERFAALGGKVSVRKNGASGTVVAVRLFLAVPRAAKTARTARGR